MKRVPRLALLFIAALSVCGFMDFVFDAAHEGNDAFTRGLFDQAAKHYTEAQIDQPTESRLDFNLGAALYKQGKLDDALTAFRKAAKSDDRDVAADARYNAGNALFQQQKLDEAIVEYTETLKLRPDDEDAKYNLELARRLLQQREQQDQDQKDQQQQNQDRQQQNQDQQQQQQQDEKPDQPQEPEEGESGEQPKEEPQPQPGDENEQQEQPEQQNADAAQAQAADEELEKLTPEQAARILDSLKKKRWTKSRASFCRRPATKAPTRTGKKAACSATPPSRSSPCSCSPAPPRPRRTSKSVCRRMRTRSWSVIP
ncbi:MAG: tetratricopeptide repeat protein [Deltaproteobacteria bacterium]|nr:tetratricopeptide repeat protein [Deltaproteobacteria bacterium]